LQLQLGAENDRREALEERLLTVTKENRALRTELGQIKRAANGTGPSADAHRRENAKLRTQISQLAAEVVKLTASVEGPDSPIHAALSAEATGKGRGTSLADRIRKLQKASHQS
jgi:predicted  nucleic acid-binding Zn-ribbon protein